MVEVKEMQQNIEQKKILIVDDEASVRDSLRLLLKDLFIVEIAVDGEEALQNYQNVNPDIVLLDLSMPKMDGVETLKKIKLLSPATPIIMLTGNNTSKSAVAAMKAGATDYLSKPFVIEELTSVIDQALEALREMQDEFADEKHNGVASSLIEENLDFGRMVGRSHAMQDLYHKIKQIAVCNTTVLITGASGTGKELVAREIHKLSARSDKPFVAINCGAIPESLIESELFGHEKGAFTHALEKRIGHCELADGGTLFLDEIGELSLSVQVKLLRFIQEQEFTRIGKSKAIKVDTRIIAATNRDLEQAVNQKCFREDLFYRINVVQLSLPTLKDRYEDIPNLIEHFVGKLAPRYQGKHIKFSHEALELMIQYDWPGNVRELENVIESLIALLVGEIVEAKDLPPKLKARGELENVKDSVLSGEVKFEDAEKQFEFDLITKALKRANYVQTRAAAILGISRRILKYKMDKLGIRET
jgi:DNA-binding NtrC family response regulator